MSNQKAKRWPKRTLTWLNRTLLLPFAVLSALLFTLLYTPAGLSFNLWLAQHIVSGFSVERSEGSLLGGNTLYGLRWHDDALTLTLEQSTLHINNDCFLRVTLCVEQLALQGLVVKVADSDSAAPAEQAPPATRLWLPFAIDITQLQLTDGKVVVAGTTLSWHQFNTAGTLWGNKIQLNQPHWQQVTLELPHTTDTEENTFTYQAPQLSDLRLPLSVFIDRFRLTDFTLQQPTPVKIAELAFSLQLLPQQISMTQLDINHPQATLYASAKIEPVGNYPLKADVRILLKDSALAGQRLRLTADGDLSNLHLKAIASELMDAELSMWLNLLDNALPLNAKLDAGQLQWPLSGAADILLNDLQIAADGSLNKLHFNAGLALNGNQFPPSRVQLNGHSSLSAATLENVTINSLGGELSGQAALNWQQQLHWLGTVQLSQIQPDKFWPDYPGELNGNMQFDGQFTAQGGWQLALPQLDLNGTLRDFKLKLDGSLNAADSSGQGEYRFDTPGLTLRHAQNQIQLAGSLAEHWQLAMTIAIPKLAQSIQGAQGDISADVSISGKRDVPQLKGSLSARMLKWQDASLQNLMLNAELGVNSERDVITTLLLQASGAKYQQQRVDQLTLSLSGSELQHKLALQLSGAEHNADIELSGSLQAGEYWQGTLLAARLDSLPGAWHLVDSTALDYRFANTQLTVQPHCWQQAPAELCAVKPLLLSASKMDVELRLHQFAMSALADMLPTQLALQGDVDAHVSANWQAGQQPQARLKLNGSTGDLRYQADRPLTLSWHSWALEAVLANDTLNSSLQWQFDNNSALQTEAIITEVQSASRQLQGKLKLQHFSLVFLQPLLEQNSELAGLLNTDLRFSGDLNHPDINGRMALSGVKLTGQQAPLDVTDATLALSFSGKQAALEGLLNTSKGKIDVTGEAKWPQIDDWQAIVNVKGDELSLQIPQAQLQVAPDLTLTARPSLTSLSGTVQIPFARISIDSLPQAAVTLSDDLVLLDETLQPLPTGQQTGLALQTDVNVVLGRRVQLSAFGLQTRLSGNLRVRQQPKQQPRVNGDVSLQDGTFRAYGQDLLIRQGKMSFNGPADQPFLNIEAIRNPANMEDDVIAGIRVTGPADEPTVSIFSEPAKPQANALAYLLMGRDIGSDSGSAGSALTTGLIGLSISSTGAVVGELGEAFGVSDLTLDTAGAGDNSQVTVSGYLSRDLQVKYGYGIFNAVGEFTLRYRLMRNLYLEAVNGLDNAVDLLYKFEFD